MRPAPPPRPEKCLPGNAPVRPLRGRTRGGTPVRLRLSVVVHEGTDLDGRADGARQLAPPGERAVEIFRLENGDAADLFLALDERAIGGHHLATLLAQYGGGIGGMQAAAEHPCPR